MSELPPGFVPDQPDDELPAGFQPQEGRAGLSVSELALSDLPHLSRYKLDGLGEYAKGAYEVARATGEGIARPTVGGLMAIPYLMSSKGREGGAAELIETTMEGQYVPQSVVGQYGMQQLGKLAEYISGGLKFVGSGYAGAGAMAGSLAGGQNLSEAASAGAEAAQEFRETGDLGERTFAATESPTLATAADVALEVAAGGARFKGVPFKRYFPEGKALGPETGPTIFDDIPEGAYGRTGDVPQARETMRFADETPPQIEPGTQADVSRALRRRDPQRTAELVNPNPVLVAAFEDLGITNFTPGMVSDSVAFRQAQSGLKSDASAGLKATDASVAEQLTSRAEDLINRIGTTDRAGLDTMIRNEYDTQIEAFRTVEAELYPMVEEAIPAGTRVPAENIINYLADRVDKLGGGQEGIDALLPSERRVFNQLFTRTEDGFEAVDPTYAKLETIRRDVGDSMSAGVFSDRNQGTLKKLYSELAEDQFNAAESLGVADLYEQAAAATRGRKRLEDQVITVMGRQGLGGSALQKIDQTARELVKGNLQLYKQVQDALPSQELRRAHAAAVLNHLLSPGAQKGIKLKAGFSDSYDSLLRNREAMDLLFDGLPGEARTRFENIARAYQGFLRSTEFDNRSNTANAIIENIRNGTILERIYGGTYDVVLRRIPFADQVTRPQGGESRTMRAQARAERADAFLASQELQKAVRDYARERNVDTAELERSVAYNEWLSTLTDAELAQITERGPLVFLFGAASEDENE